MPLKIEIALAALFIAGSAAIGAVSFHYALGFEYWSGGLFAALAAACTVYQEHGKPQ